MLLQPVQGNGDIGKRAGLPASDEHDIVDMLVKEKLVHHGIEYRGACGGLCDLMRNGWKAVGRRGLEPMDPIKHRVKAHGSSGLWVLRGGRGRSRRFKQIQQ
jgi:hypothetical protein